MFASLATALLLTTPAMGQITNFPVLALGAGGATTIGAGYGRGLNDNSGKLDSFGAGFAAGSERIAFGASGAYVLDVAPDQNELTLGGQIGVHLLSDAPVQLTLQSGLGWMKQDVGTASLTSLHIPIGVAIQSSGDSNIRPWVMPRVSLVRTSGDAVAESSTDTKFGASAGLTVASEGGVGVGLALDMQRADGGTEDVSVFGLGAYVFYVLP